MPQTIVDARGDGAGEVVATPVVDRAPVTQTTRTAAFSDNNAFVVGGRYMLRKRQAKEPSSEDDERPEKRTKVENSPRAKGSKATMISPST